MEAIAAYRSQPLAKLLEWRLNKEGWELHSGFGQSSADAVLRMHGLLASQWLSRWLESGRWYIFGIYCLVAAAAVRFLHHLGY